MALEAKHRVVCNTLQVYGALSFLPCVPELGRGAGASGHQ